MGALDGVLVMGVLLCVVVAGVALIWARRAVDQNRNLATATSDWTWTVDLEGQILSTNESCLEVLGYTAKELIGQNAAIFMDPRELLRAESMVKAAGLTADGLDSLIISATHRDGSNSWLEVHIEPEVDASGVMVGCRGVSRRIGPDAAQVVASTAMRARIQRIIDNRLLVTAFQPIVDVRTGRVLGAEALSRMVDEPFTRPEDWFTEAAAIGLGADLELLAVQTALAAAVALPSELAVSVNVSPESCLDERLSAMIGSSPIDTRRLVLEVTEHSQVMDYAPLRAALCRFRQSGIRIAVDDAGAGFASGQHIVKIRPDILKLDRSIISAIDTHPDQRALAAGFVAFATHIGAKLTAEGIETADEATAVAGLGIHSGQGFLYGQATLDVRVWRSWNRLLPQSRQLPTPPAVAEMTVPDAAFGLAVLDALPDPTAVVDTEGVIIAVNTAWRSFTVEGGGDPVSTGVGVNYLDVCSRAGAAGSTEAQEVMVDLRAVLTGEAILRESEYACHNSSGPRWFVARISSLDGGGPGALISHVNVTRRRRSEDELIRQSSRDPVTGLVNPLQFHRKLTESLRKDPAHSPDYAVGVMSISLEGLRLINHEYGHSAGDELLLIAAERLSTLIRLQDTVARIGPDRFGVCAPEITTTALLTMADRIRDALGVSYPVHGRQLTVMTGVGSHLAAPGMDAAEAMRAADHDLYAVEQLHLLTASSGTTLS